MEPIKIVITKESIYKHIFATSAHMTRSREAMGIPASIGERMLVTADEKEMLDPHITTCTAILSAITRAAVLNLYKMSSNSA